MAISRATDYRDVLGEPVVRRCGLPRSALAQAFPGHTPAFVGVP